MSKEPTSKDTLSNDASARLVPTALPGTPPTPGPTPGDPQMDPGQRQARLYTFTDGAGSVVAKVIVPKVDGTFGGASLVSGWEYWYDVSPAPPAGSLVVAWIDFDWSAPPRTTALTAQSFRMTQAPSWVAEQPRYKIAASFVGQSMIICWNLVGTATGAWSGDLTWYTTTGQNRVFQSTQQSGSETLAANVACNTQLTWYKAVVPPV